MKNLNLANKFKNLHIQLNRTVNNVKKDNNQIDWSKEEIIKERLELKLGKSRDEVNKLLSKNLLDLLTMVPFSMEKDSK